MWKSQIQKIRMESDMSTPPREQGGRKAGYVLVTSLLIMFIMTVMGVTQLRVASKSFQAAGVERDYRQAYNCAHSALEVGIEYVRNGGGQPVGCDKSINNCNCANICAAPPCSNPKLYSPQIKAFGLMNGLDAAGCMVEDGAGNWITQIIVDPLDPPPTPSEGAKLDVAAYRIVAQSASRERPDIHVAVSSTFYIDNFAKFVYFTDQENLPQTATSTGGANQPSITGGAYLNAGDIHSNDWKGGLRIWDATLLGKVSVVCPCGQNTTCEQLAIDCCANSCAATANTKNTQFLGGLTQGAPQIPLPSRSQMATILSHGFTKDESTFVRSDEPIASDPAAIKLHSGFFGNTWVKFNLNGDTRYNATLAVTSTSAFALAIKFDALSVNTAPYVGTADLMGLTPLCVGYPACPAMISSSGATLPLADEISGPDFIGVLLQYGDGMNFLENSLAGSRVVDSNGNQWVVVTNDRDTLILGLDALGNAPANGASLRLAHSPVTIFNAHYNQTTEVPKYWGNQGTETIASLINKVGRAVNFGWGVDAGGQPQQYSDKFPPIACSLNYNSGNCNATDARADLVFGVRKTNFSAIAGYGSAPSDFWNIGSPPQFSIPNIGSSDNWAQAGQGAAAGVNFSGAPPSGLISVYDLGHGSNGCRPVDQEVVDALSNNPSPDDKIPSDPRPLVLPGNCGFENGDIRVWGAVNGRWSLVTMRDIRVIGNRASLPVWDNAFRSLIPNHVAAAIHWASGIAKNNATNYPMKVWKEGHLPVTNSEGPGGAQNTIDQSGNIFGVVYANNTDKKDVDFQSHDGHLLGIAPGGVVPYIPLSQISDPLPSGCDTAYWGAKVKLLDGGYESDNSALGVDVCTSITRLIPWRNYKPCVGDTLGLFAYQNVIIEDPSPQSDVGVGKLIHTIPVDMAIEGLIIAAGGMLTPEHYSGKQADPCWPDVANWYSGDDQYDQPGFANPDRANYCLPNGNKPYPIGSHTKVEVSGGQIQKYRGNVHTTNGNEPNINFQYDECFRVTGAPPFTPSFPTANSRLDYSRLPRGTSVCANSL